MCLLIHVNGCTIEAVKHAYGLNFLIVYIVYPTYMYKLAICGQDGWTGRLDRTVGQDGWTGR